MNLNDSFRYLHMGVPDDIARLAHRVLRHRLILGFEAATARITPWQAQPLPCFCRYPLAQAGHMRCCPRC